jgi:DNA (cytosine-5)-methyltransferase 1
VPKSYPDGKYANGSALGQTLTVVGLFAGIGGLERGLELAGHEISTVCEIAPCGRKVLGRQFPKALLEPDIRILERLPRCDLVVAGFPCQDLSQAGTMTGIRGKQSSLVKELFRLVASAKRRPRWLVLENVPFMLRLNRGRAMMYLTTELSSLGYAWAYRTVDSRSFGLPQRRKRVILVASRREDPRAVLFADSYGSEPRILSPTAFGFYWTEGNKGLGWATDAVPTLKGGSSFGIPSPPAIWIRETSEIVTLDLRDAERLQGLPADWTAAADEIAGARKGTRWRLVGNAVSVPVAEWVGRRLVLPGTPQGASDIPVDRARGWPGAAWGADGKAFRAEVSEWPLGVDMPRLLDFLRFPVRKLSARATSGFLCRARASRLRFVDGFLDDVARHLRQLDPDGKYPERKEQPSSA